MKNLIHIGALLSAVILLSAAPVATAEQKAEAEIRKWLDDWAKAFRAHDLEAIMSLYAPDVVAYDIVPPLQYVGKDAYRKDYAQFLEQYAGPIDVEFRDVKVFVGGDMAVAIALERLSGTMKSGQKSDVWVRTTTAFRKINGKWLDIHDHVSVPADFDSGKAMLDLKP
jgi:uncharacterized protein (TIGR02246 family)